MEITRLEAKLLLKALDNMLGVDKNSRVFIAAEGYTREFCQSLRDRLFANVSHLAELEVAK